MEVNEDEVQLLHLRRRRDKQPAQSPNHAFRSEFSQDRQKEDQVVFLPWFRCETRVVREGETGLYVDAMRHFAGVPHVPQREKLIIPYIDQPLSQGIQRN